MSNLPGNPIGEKYGDKQGLSAEVVAALIVAHEIRTANLLKVLELQGQMLDVTQAFNLSAFDVASRLGLGDTNGNV